MTAWLLLACGLGLLLGCSRLGDAWLRRAGQGVGMLLAAGAALLLLRRPGAPVLLPGHGPRRWQSP